MSKTSYTLLLHKSELSYTGNPVRVDVFSGSTQNLHTVSVQYTNFVGRFYLEGTLEANPSSNDWFPIYLGTKNPYKQYPFIETSPTGTNNLGDTGNDGFTFRANLLYIRASVDRNYLDVETYDQNLHGSIDKVLINI